MGSFLPVEGRGAEHVCFAMHATLCEAREGPETELSWSLSGWLPSGSLPALSLQQVPLLVAFLTLSL